MISTDSVMGATSHQHSLRMRINRTIQQKRGSAGAPNVWTGLLGWSQSRFCTIKWWILKWRIYGKPLWKTTRNPSWFRFWKQFDEEVFRPRNISLNHLFFQHHLGRSCGANGKRSLANGAVFLKLPSKKMCDSYLPETCQWFALRCKMIVRSKQKKKSCDLFGDFRLFASWVDVVLKFRWPFVLEKGQSPVKHESAMFIPSHFMVFRPLFLSNAESVRFAVRAFQQQRLPSITWMAGQLARKPRNCCWSKPIRFPFLVFSPFFYSPNTPT